MASAVLASRNESYWGARKVYMRKYSNTATTTNNDKRTTPFVNIDQYPTQKTLIKPNKPVRIPDPVHFRQRDACPTPRETTTPNGEKVRLKESSSHGGCVTYNLGVYTRRELNEVRRRLVSELEQVRALKNWLDTLNQESRPVYPNQPSQISTIWSPSPPPSQLTAATATTHPIAKKSHQTKRKALGSQGSKRRNAFSKDLGPNPKRTGMDPLAEEILSSMKKRCGQILGKLMKQRFAWVFNKPVDVAGLGLFDYHQIIKKPMDLGTVKMNLENDAYKSPSEFAADVRLTFDNAMAYNPKQHDVHIVAQNMLAKFNEMFNPAYKKFEEEKIRVSGQISNPLVQPVVVEPVQPVGPAVMEAALMKKKEVMMKPKAREVNKRDMTFEEKERLGKELEELPGEKMVQLLSIVRKRNRDLALDGDEIELDMASMDTKTLWELDRFVSKYKKMISKIKHAEAGAGAGAGAGQVSSNLPITLPVPDPETDSKDAVTKSEMVDVGQKGGGGEEDVDIGEEMPLGNYPPVEIEKDVNVTSCCSGRSGSSSSSRSGSDSTSSGSNSGSSSGSDSDADSVQSPYVEANHVEMT